MTTRRGRRQLPTDGQSSRIQAIPVSQAIDLAHCPTTSHDDDQVEALRWPSTACASLEGQGFNLGQMTRVVDTAG
ncbi:MAG: hypothetical protein ACJ782_02935, partial [Actinomycetota bacterium]